MKVAVVFLPFALLGCGNSSGDASHNGFGREANYIADRFDADCRSIKAPDPKSAKDLDQLCSCSTDQIRSTIHEGDPREVADRKIDQARMDCLRKVYPNG